MPNFLKEDGIAERIAQQSPDALLLVDAQGTIVYVNAAASTVFGYARSELLGRPIESLVPETARNRHERYRHGFALRPATREMGARIVALSACRRDGTEFPVEIRLAPVEHQSGALVLAAVRDVTERRQITDELRRARAEADSANKAKSRFLATASHDLRQPLQTLQLLNAALGTRLQDPSTLELVHRQRSALDSMADLLNALLDITKLESGMLKPTLENVSLADLLADLRRECQDLAAARGLTLTIDSAVETVHTDRLLFRQMLQNLLSNAIKYTNVGSVTLTAHNDADALVLTVTDTGVGIPVDEIERVFDDYYRVDMPGTLQRGFGLGLTIVRQIARLLGHAVTVRSELGRGSAFAVRIPLPLVTTTAVSDFHPAAPHLAETGVAKPSVLIVEDDPAVREALELLLALEGYPVRVAASAAAAQDIFARKGAQIDLVVSDFHLGEGMDGLALIASLRAAVDRDLPAVILSGDTSTVLDTIQTVSRATLLRKPVDARRLIAAMEALFGAAD